MSPHTLGHQLGQVRDCVSGKDRTWAPTDVRLSSQRGALCLCFLLGLETQLKAQVTGAGATRGWEAKRGQSWRVSVAPHAGSQPQILRHWEWLFGGAGGDRTPHLRAALALRELGEETWVGS